MRFKYAQKLQNKQKQETKVLHTLIENRVLDKNTGGYQAVKMIFLDEKEADEQDWKANTSDLKDRDDYASDPFNKNGETNSFESFKSMFERVFSVLLF
jgi:hypothetical protein